jgi:hypothetical protein
MVTGEEQLAGSEQDVGEPSEKPTRTMSDEEAGRGGASRCSRLRRPTGSTAPHGVRPMLRPVESGTAGDGAVGNGGRGGSLARQRSEMARSTARNGSGQSLTLTSRRTGGIEVGAGPGLAVSQTPFALYGVASFSLIW